MKSTLVILPYNEVDGLQALYEKIPVKSANEFFARDGSSTDVTLEFYGKE